MTTMFLRSGGVILVACLGLVGRPAIAQQQQYEPLRQKLLQGWQKARPETGQVVPISFSAANSLPAPQGRAMDGTGRLLSKDRGQFSVKDGQRKYELYENLSQQVFSLDSGPWKLVDSREHKDHPGLISFLSPREAMDLLLGGGFEKITPGAVTVVGGGALCEALVMELGEGHARPLLMRLGLSQELVTGKRKKRTVYRAAFLLETRTGRLRQMTVTLRVEVDRDAKPGKDFEWEEYDDSDPMYGVFKLDEKGQPIPGGGKDRKTMLREYSLLLSIDLPKPLEKEPEVPQEAKSLIHW